MFAVQLPLYIYMYIYNRLPNSKMHDFLWTISEKNIQFENLQGNQIVNHFEGISKLTTKSGLCDILHNNMRWLNEDKDDIIPKCFNLSDAAQKQMFLEEYRLTTLIHILQVCF